MVQQPASGAATVAAVPLRSRSVGAGVLVGLGLAAFVDEAVFHQLLHWHHFYDRGGPDAGLVSDGLFHAGGWLAIVAGLFLYPDLQRRPAPGVRAWWGGVPPGPGGLRLYGGVLPRQLPPPAQNR